MPFLSKASYTKNDSIIDDDSSQGQTAGESIFFVVKQGSYCFDKREEREFSELSTPQRKHCFPELFVMHSEDTCEANIHSLRATKLPEGKLFYNLCTENLIIFTCVL